MNGYLTYHGIQKKYDVSNYGIAGKNYRKIQKLIDVGELEAITYNNCLYISKDSIEKYMEKIDKIRNDYFNIHDFLNDFLGGAVRSKEYITRLKKFTSKTCIELIELDPPITLLEKYFINKESYRKFKNDYISLPEAIGQLGTYKGYAGLRNALQRKGVKIVSFTSDVNYMFFKQEELESIEKVPNTITVKEAIKELGLKPCDFYQFLRDNNIKTFMNYSRTYIKKEELEQLKKMQEEEYIKLEENYYTSEEIYELHKRIGRNPKYFREKATTFTRCEITYFARIRKFKCKTMIYKKSEIDDYINKCEVELEVIRLCDITSSNFYSLFLQLIRLEIIEFPDIAKKTKELWFDYVKYIITNTNGTRDNHIRRIINLKNTSKVLISTLIDKEFFNLTENEINLRIFNNINVPFAYKKEIYTFMSTIYESFVQYGKKLFDLNKINFKHGDYNGHHSKEVYSINEYLALSSFVRDFEEHRKLAIEDVKTALKNIKQYKDTEKVLSNNKLYKKYDSIWLYVLLHMNNGWRNGDIINFPRYPSRFFDKYNLTDIHSLENLKLTETDAERIVKYYQLQWYKHNKTQRNATFYCSSILTTPMAYAILICEFRCRMSHVYEESLINFYNKYNVVNASVHNNFFKDFLDVFKFESRKMNRTVLTLTESVTKGSLKDDPLEIAQHLRGHADKETTNIYIVIPQEHMDFIAHQLFDTGYFGFVYDKVANLLTGDTPKSRTEQTERALQIKEFFGDVVKLEDTAMYLKYLSKEHQELGEYIESLPQEELYKKMSLFNLGLSPAKMENYQCFFTECFVHRVECDKCVFSIPNFYTLATLCERVKRTLVRYRDSLKDENIPDGEKTKLFNLLLNDYDKILSAKSKFGAEIIEMFLELDFTEFDSTFDSIVEPDSQP